jgi:hypothetical protein
MNKKTILCVLCLLMGGKLCAQEAVEVYLAEARSHASIYTGKEGYKYPRYILNHPYWDTNDYREGSLWYDGVLYPNVWMRLDLHREELLLRSPDRRFEVVAPAERMDSAWIHPYCIRWVGREEAAEKALPPGYYIRLNEGNYPVWKRETKHLTRSANTGSQVVDTQFEEITQFYVCREGVWHVVKNAASLLALFPEKKKELKQYIRRQKLNFKKAPDAAIVETVRRYERLHSEP